MTAPLITYTWDGASLVPLRRFHNAAASYFDTGAEYQMIEHHVRSLASHGHYFASLTEAWNNLPEDQADRFATVEHLRKYALIRTGYRDERSIVCASKAEAQRLAAFIKPLDEYAVVVASEAVVTVYTAKSQSMKAMGAKDFQASKTAVLEFVSAMIGVEPSALQSARAA